MSAETATGVESDSTPATFLAEICEKAEAWLKRQCEISALAMGPQKWAEHREWVEAYLREEIRMRLVVRQTGKQA